MKDFYYILGTNNNATSTEMGGSKYVMSGSEFHFCLCDSEAGGEMKPAAIACVV